MRFNNILGQLYKIKNFQDFQKENGLSVYKNLLREIKPDNEEQLKKASEVSDHLEKILLDARRFSLALDLYNYEIDYFHKNYTSEKLAAAYKKSMLLYTVLETISKNEDYAITDSFENLIKHFERSNDFIHKRWNDLFLKIVSHLPLTNLNEDLNQLLECDLNNLIAESEFHTNHYVYYLKDAYQKLQKIYKKCHEQSLTDDLTKLHNRRHLYANFPNLIYLALRQKKSISLVIFDIDDFKIINDTYGHQKGDEVLIKTAETVRNFVRKSDLTIRFGGDEFLLLLYDAQATTAVMIAESIKDSINQIHFEDDSKNSFNVSMSVGITSKVPFKVIADDSDINQFFEELVKEADIAMYHAKYNEKNKVKIYHPGLHSIIN